MFDLVETAEKIIFLVDTHCEPSDCKIKNCETCAEIKLLRDKIGKDERENSGMKKRKTSGGCKGKYTYVVSKNGKEVGRVGSTYKVAEIIGINASHITYMVKNNRPSRGYEVKRYLRDLEEIK